MCNRRNIWTDEALAFLNENYASTSNAELASLLGISPSSLKKKARELELGKKSSYKLTDKVKKAILSMYHTNSYQSIADKLFISRRTVARFIKDQKEKGLQPRNKEEDLKIMSDYRINQYKSERARATFGFPQKTGYKLFPNKNKYWIRQSLRKYGYLVGRNSLEVFITPLTKTHRKLEQRAKKCGFEFFDGDDFEDDIIILPISYREFMNREKNKEIRMFMEDVYPMDFVSPNGPAEEQIAAEFGLLQEAE